MSLGAYGLLWYYSLPTHDTPFPKMSKMQKYLGVFHPSISAAHWAVFLGKSAFCIDGVWCLVIPNPFTMILNVNGLLWYLSLPTYNAPCPKMSKMHKYLGVFHPGISAPCTASNGGVSMCHVGKSRCLKSTQQMLIATNSWFDDELPVLLLQCPSSLVKTTTSDKSGG